MEKRATISRLQLAPFRDLVDKTAEKRTSGFIAEAAGTRYVPAAEVVFVAITCDPRATHTENHIYSNSKLAPGDALEWIFYLDGISSPLTDTKRQR